MRNFKHMLFNIYFIKFGKKKIESPLNFDIGNNNLIYRKKGKVNEQK